MKKNIIKRLNQIVIEILKADEAELNRIGAELLDIEKKLLTYNVAKTSTLDKIKKYYLNEYDKIFILGDATDRGPKKDGTGGVELLLQLV